MSATSQTDPAVSPDMDAIMADISALRRDLAAVVRHLGRNAETMATEAVGQISQEATRVYDRAAARGERSVRAVTRQVETQPLASILIAFAVGFVGSRILSAPYR